MQGLLVLIAIYIGGYFLVWIIRKISALVQFYKYLDKLNQLRPVIDNIDLGVAEEEFKRVNMQTSSTIDRLQKKFKISVSSTVPSISDYIKADELAQKAKRRKAQPRKQYFRRRYWR